MSTKGDIPKFEPLPMRRRTLAAFEANQYCIWTGSGETKEIKADTAYEAVIKSGQQDIIKIERASNIRRNLLEQTKFEQDGVSVGADGKTEAPSEKETAQEHIRRRRNPIITAGELDELMKALSKGDPIPEPEPAAPEISAPATLEAAPPAHSEMAHHEIQASEIQAPEIQAPEIQAMEPPPVPVPAPMTAPTEQVGAIGLDVHGDGFDEIIPAAPQAKPHAARPHHEPKDAKQAAPAAEGQSELPPSKELSADEVEKLLQGKQE